MNGLAIHTQPAPRVKQQCNIIKIQKETIKIMSPVPGLCGDNFKSPWMGLSSKCLVTEEKPLLPLNAAFVIFLMQGQSLDAS